jgi:hypothetical protein
VAGYLPCIEVREKTAEGFASMADMPQQATGQPQVLESQPAKKHKQKGHKGLQVFWNIENIRNQCNIIYAVNR